MSIADSIQRQMVPIHKEGYPFIAGFAVLALILFWLWQPLGWLGTIVTVWCVYFFRDPPRVTPVDDTLVISPADGRVCLLGPAVPPPELGLGTEPMERVCVFMSVFDCHVNRMPIAGRITRIAYTPGKFLNADLDKASEDNERNGFVIDGPYGRVGMVQIAGLIARRIVCFSHEGDSKAAGERVGLIRFGSRVDVYLPAGARVLAGLDTTAIAGETVLAEFTTGAKRGFRVG